MSSADALAATIETAERLESQGMRKDAKLALAQALGSAPQAKRGILGKLKKATKSARHQEAARRFAELAAAAPSPGDIELLERLTADYPADTFIRAAFAAALCAAGRRAEGVAEFEECVRKSPGDGRVLAALASEYAALGKRDEALDRFRRGLDCLLHDHLTEAACAAARGIAALQPSSLDDAVRVVALAREGDPAALPGALERFAALCHGEGKMEQEAAAWAELLLLSPERDDVRRELAGAYTRILDSDANDTDAWRGLEAADPGLAAELRVLLMALSDESGPA
jgi:tetratricopeptide (TPR) repeat protein